MLLGMKIGRARPSRTQPILDPNQKGRLRADLGYLKMGFGPDQLSNWTNLGYLKIGLRANQTFKLGQFGLSQNGLRAGRHASNFKVTISIIIIIKMQIT